MLAQVADNHMGEFVQFIRSDLVPLRCTKLQKISAGVADSPGKFLRVEIRHRHEVTKLFQTINEFNSHFLIQFYLWWNQETSWWCIDK